VLGDSPLGMNETTAELDRARRTRTEHSFDVYNRLLPTGPAKASYMPTDFPYSPFKLTSPADVLI
jgi:hypothetical protein